MTKHHSSSPPHSSFGPTMANVIMMFIVPLIPAYALVPLTTGTRIGNNERR